MADRDGTFHGTNPAASRNKLCGVRVGENDLIQPFTSEIEAEMWPVIREQFPRYYVLCRLCRWAGMRIGEASALKRSDVDLARRKITLRRIYRSSTHDVGDLKTQEGTHGTHSPAPRGRATSAARNSRSGAKLHAWTGEDREWLFPTGSGRPKLQEAIYKRFWSKLRKVVPSMGDRRVHDLRHTFATDYLTNGVNPQWVSRQLGHHDPAFTMRVYGHLIPDANEAAVDTLLRGRERI